MIARFRVLGLRRKIHHARLRRMLNSLLQGEAYTLDEKGIYLKGKMIIPRDKVVPFLRNEFTPEVPGSKVVAKVGIMTATTTPGKDGKLGTEDDETVVTVNKPEWDYEPLDDGTFKCRYCDKILKTEKGIVNHVDNEVCR